jgi:hypothetical protein
MAVYGTLHLGIRAAEDLLPTRKVLELDMLLVELQHVGCEEDLNASALYG